MKFDLVHDYKHNDILRKSFNDLAQKTFGISFEEWYQKGMWTDIYECWSLSRNNTIVSNVSVSKLHFIINGIKKSALQIGTVMTDPAYRGRGLAKELFNTVLNRFESTCDIMYLFADQSVLDFYPRFGFERAPRAHLAITEPIEKNHRHTFRKLDMDNTVDVGILKYIAEHRIPDDTAFRVEGGESILYWYCVNFFKNNIYIDDRKKLIVIFENIGDTLLIHDIITTEIKDYRKIIGSIENISRDSIREIIINRPLAAQNISLEKRIIEDDDDALFVKGDFDKTMTIIHPITAHA